MSRGTQAVSFRQSHRLYYLLALFDVLAVAGGLYLTHRIVTVFSDSVTVNKEWVTRLERYSALAGLAAELSAPANDVFVDLNPDAQARRLQQAADRFEQSLNEARLDLLLVLPPGAREIAAADFDAAALAERSMVAEAAQVFDHMRRHEPGLAGRRAALMNRHYIQFTFALNKLREDGRQMQRAVLEADRDEAQLLKLYQLPLGAAFLCVVAAATLYGLRISRETQAVAREREGYIEQLQQSEASLERRIQERTAELRQNEQRLAKSDERFQYAARATNDALWDWDIENGSLWWGEGFGSLFGYQRMEPSRDFWTSLVHPDDVEQMSDGVAQFLESRGDVWSAEYRLRRADDSYAWVLDRGFAIRDAGGKVRRMIGSMMDISERKESERMKSDFVSFVSHQLRTPLSGMSWMLELAAETDDLPPSAREYIADARESANRLVTLVNDLLDIARLENGRTGAVPGDVALEELTRSVLHEFQGLVAEKRHDVMLRAEAAATAWVDAQLIRQVIVNLLSNAIKYTPPGGRIDVSLEQHNGTVQWSVRDTGLGVPRLAQNRLFEKFYRAENVQKLEAEGTGLGLHLVRLIVQQAGGRVWCESAEGQGSLFAFTLPTARKSGEA